MICNKKMTFSYFIIGSDPMYEIYKVLENDTLDKIAKKFNTTIDNLYEINGLTNNYILSPSTSIIVPNNSNNPYKYYTVKKGDNIYQLAKNNNIDQNLLLKINGLDKDDYIYPNQTLLIPKNNYNVYLTQNEDTIKSISERINKTPSSILEENPNLYIETDQIIIFKEK